LYQAKNILINTDKRKSIIIEAENIKSMGKIWVLKAVFINKIETGR